MKDLCLNCGSELESELWGATCSCSAPNVVHQQLCNGCSRIVGQITDDDYCAPEKLYCSDCMEQYLSTKNKDGIAYKKRYWISFTRGLDSRLNTRISGILDAFEFRNKDISKGSYRKYMSKLYRLDKKMKIGACN